MTEPVAVEDQAKALGWVPQEEFRGDPERWVDAETFVDKGRHIMPILQKNNEKLQGELSQLRQQQQATQEALRAAQEAIANMEEQHTVQTQRAVNEARRELKAQIAVASENGDHAGLAELTDQLMQMPVEVAKPEKKQALPEPAPAVNPEFLAWQQANPWFGVDTRRTALANAVGQELRAKGSPLVGRPFWDAVAAEVQNLFEPKAEPAADKVEGSRAHGGSSGKGSTYADLPADAKEACDADIRSRVGAGKRYATAAEWRSKYAEIYFGMEK